MLFSLKSCTDGELIKLPKSRHLDRKLNVTWHQCITKMGPKRIKLNCELKVTYISLLSTVCNFVNIT